MLDESQQRIAGHLRGGLLVLAPVGTGKTFALTERIAGALDAGFEPGRILCLTFTNRAAQEVRTRLAERFPRPARALTVETFHGLCATILRREARQIGLATDFTICDDEDSIELLRELGPAERNAAQNLSRAIQEQKSRPSTRELTWPPDWARIFHALGDGRLIAERYQRELAAQHKVDYGDLVLLVGSLLQCQPEVRRRWEQRFDFVQVDEVQDTHKSEYRVVWVLAHRSRNLALFGDVDQTIYGWRGSEPFTIIEQFRQNFAPVTELALTVNRRATRQLVQAAASFATTFAARTRVLPSPDSPVGLPLELHQAADPPAEARWIGERIGELVRSDDTLEFRRVGVLVRAHYRAEAISQGLHEVGIPHLTVEAYEFFRRQEIKDALARLRLILSPADAGALPRLLERPANGPARGAVARLRKAGERFGLRPVDLLRPETFDSGEPFGTLLDAYHHAGLVVLDVETTGTSPQRDRVIEIAATRLVRGRPTERFQALLASDVPVGESEAIHGVGDALLAAEGRPPAEVLAEFFDFRGDDLLVGHNVGFDLRMLSVQAQRLGLEPPAWESADTLQLARRFLDSADYSLEALAAELRLPHRPSHRAETDVAATCDLLAHLVPLAEADSDARAQLLAELLDTFAPLAEQLQRWRELAGQLRPAELLARVLDESGLRDYYASREASEPRRLAHLDELAEIFAARDNPTLDPLSALEDVVRYAALSRNLDLLRQGDDRVPVLTIHQAKGLEFDVVFIAGLCDDELPSKRSIAGDLEEERRLFYVALTRARRHLVLTHHARTEHGYQKRPSRFLAGLGPGVLPSV